MLPFLLHHVIYFLFLILTYFVSTQLNHLQCVFKHIIKKIQYCNVYDFLKQQILFCIQCFLFFLQTLLSKCGDTEKNPGLKYSSLSCCHWNLYGLKAHDCIKITLIQAYITDQNLNIIYLSETFLNSSIQNDDHQLKIEDYNLIRSDHPSGSKKGGVIYYKVQAPFIRHDDLCTLDKCLVIKIRLHSEKCFLICT